MTTPDTCVAAFRIADPEEARALTDLERDADLVAPRHVFDPAEHRFPFDVVRHLAVRPDRRARGLYEARGWPPTGPERQAAFPPYRS